MGFPVIDPTITGFVGKKGTWPLTRRKTWNTEVVSYDSSSEQTNELWSYPVRFWSIRWRLLNITQRNKMLELFDACRGQARQLYFKDSIDYQSTYSWTQPDWTIGDVDQDEDYFRITGQHASKFLVGWEFLVDGSTGNDGVYTVEKVSQDASYTYIYVEEEIPHATADGNLLRMYFQLCKEYYTGEDYAFTEPKQDIIPGEITVDVDDRSWATEGVDYTLTDTEGVIMFDSALVPVVDAVIEVVFDFYYRVRFVSDEFEDVNHVLEYYNPDVVSIKEIKRHTSII